MIPTIPTTSSTLFSTHSPTTLFALQTPVSLGSLQNNRYPVTKGLDVGQKVITSNLLSLRHGVPVKVSN